MAHTERRERARELRHEGSSISDIAKRLRTSKSTISYWCRDVALTKRQIQRLATARAEGGALGRLRAAEVKRNTRIEATVVETQKGARDVGTLNRRDMFILGIALYWGEGYKSGNEECGLTNSNPAIILTFLRWLQREHKVSLSDLILRVSINAQHRDRINDVEQYWSRVTGIPRSQFTKASLIKALVHKTYRDRNSHFGTLRVKVRRGTALRRRILGGINEISRQIYVMK